MAFQQWHDSDGELVPPGRATRLDATIIGIAFAEDLATSVVNLLSRTKYALMGHYNEQVGLDDFYESMDPELIEITWEEDEDG